MIIRSIADVIHKELEDKASRRVLLISGARQVGKTTLISELLKQLPFTARSTNLERSTSFRDQIDQTRDFLDFQRLLTSELGFDPGRQEILFIDEAQESRELGSYLRFMKEDWKARVVLTGSSMTRLFTEATRIPVGRYREFLLTPLNFEEFLHAKNDQSLLEIFSEAKSGKRLNAISAVFHQRFLSAFDEYIRVGGLPEVVTTYFAAGDWQDIQREIFSSQKNDFVRKTKDIDPVQLADAMNAIANHLGFPSKFTQIADSNYQARKIVSQLSAWRLIYQIEQKGLASTSSFAPKRYLYDHGIAQLLRTAPFPQLSLLNSANSALRTQLGGLLENIVLNQLIACQAHTENISGWKKDAHGETEIDFVWRSDRNIIPVECKCSLKISRRNFSALDTYLKTSDQKTGVLVSAAPYLRIQNEDRTLINLPVYLPVSDLIRGGLITRKGRATL